MSSSQLNSRSYLPTLLEYPETGLTMTRKASKSAPELDRNCSPTTYNPPTFAPPGFNPGLPKRRLSYADPPAYKPALESTPRKRAMSSPMFPSKFSREESEVCIEEETVPKTILTPTVFGRKPQVVYCTSCDTKNMTVTKKKIGKAAKFTATILIPAAPLVFLIPHLKDTVHKCSNCRQVVGKHRQRIF